jgi:UbiD family decarboxylase
MAQDLRTYLDAVKKRKPDEFQVVTQEVDPAFEITAIVVKLEREAKKRPVLLFEKVKGTRFPVLTNLHASRSRLASAMRCAPDQMLRAYLTAMDKPIPPRVVAKGPVKDVILTGEQIDLHDLPQIIHHEGDAGVYLTSAISFAKDPASETWNCAYNRLMIKGRDTTSIHLTLGKHLWEFQRIAEARGEALPVAFAVGVHPAIALGSLAIGSIDEDERAIMGALLGEPLELVKCETSDVLVPAHAEMVIEAEILPGARTPEGPFGEFTGYSLGQRDREVVKVKAITHRAGAWFQDITVAHLDHLLLSTIPMEANLYRAVRAMIPSVKAVRVPGPFTCYVSIEQRLPGQAKNALLAGAGRRSLHEARGGGGPRRGRLRRPAGELGHRHALSAGPRHHRDHAGARLGSGSLHQGGRAHRQVGRGRDGQAVPRRLYAAARVPPEVAQRIDLKAFGL